MLIDAQPMIFLPSTDLDRSRRFFEHLLGIPVQEQSRHALVARVGPATMRIGWVERLVPQPFTIFGWLVDDIAAEAAQLSQRGVSFLLYEGVPQDQHGIWTAPSGDRVAWFNDPDGNVLSLTQLSGH